MLICRYCIARAGKKVPENLVIGSCFHCMNPIVECAESNAVFNIGPTNWHKYSEEKHCSSSPEEFEIPENGLYLWLRPITKTQHQDQQSKAKE